MIALALLLAFQAPPPQVDASVDRDRVQVGDELTLRVRAISRSAAPLTITLPPYDGLALVSRTEHTEVSLLGPEATRVTTVEYRLRGLRPGRWQLGPAEAVQGGQNTQADPLFVEVVPSPAAAAAALSPRVRRLIEGAAPPTGPPHVALQLLLSADTVLMGQQVDLVTLAWFPRSIRQQLRRPPLLQPPTLDGVWSYPQPTPLGVVQSRQAGDAVYDVYLAHQVVFPLTPGRHLTTPATLKYSLPVALQFFSQEERYAVTARPTALVVRALPSAGRPAAFGGAVGTALTLDRTVTPTAARAGETISVELSLTGYGNVALWPAPEVSWPGGARVYSDRVDDQVTIQNGLVGGRKTFRYLIVPDSAGALPLPAVSYPYFDAAEGRYRRTALAATGLPVASAGEASGARVEPPPVLTSARPGGVWRLVHALPAWAWVLLLLLPPALWALRRWRPRRSAARRGPDRAGAGGAEQEFEACLAALVPDPDRRAGPGLVRALRAAGIQPQTAAEAAELRDLLLAGRYGPAPVAVTPELNERLTRIARRLGRVPRRSVALFALLAALAAPVRAQTPDPSELYRSGALRAAAEGYARRAAAQPAAPAPWYDLGATEYRMGEEGRAAAHWLRAARLAPGNRTIQRALELVPPPDAATARMVWTAPVTPEALVLAALVFWFGGWALLVQPRLRLWGRVLCGVALLAGAGAAGLHWWYRRPLALITEDLPARLSPVERAPAAEQLAEGRAVRPVRRQGGWVLVAVSGRELGWVPADALVPVVE